MELDEAIRSRRMTRRFESGPVEPAVLEHVLGVACYAPSAGRSDGVELLALVDAERRATFWELASERSWRETAADAPGLLAAPVIVVPIADPTAYTARYGREDKANSSLSGLSADSWPVPYWLVDASFASMLVLLAANNAGLGALFFRLHGDADAVLTGLGVPSGRTAIGAVALGRRENEAAPGGRRPLREHPVHVDYYRGAR